MTTLQAMGSPHTVQRSWDMSRSAPIAPAPQVLRIKTLSSKDLVEIDGLVEGTTVGELKYQIMQRMSLPPRKAIALRWYGSLIEDAHTLSHYRIPENAILEMSMTTRPASEVEEMKTQVVQCCAIAHAVPPASPTSPPAPFCRVVPHPVYRPGSQLRQVRIKSMDGKVGLIDGVKPCTKVAEIKKALAERKLFKPEEGYLVSRCRPGSKLRDSNPHELWKPPMSKPHARSQRRTTRCGCESSAPLQHCVAAACVSTTRWGEPRRVADASCDSCSAARTR